MASHFEQVRAAIEAMNVACRVDRDQRRLTLLHPCGEVVVRFDAEGAMFTMLGLAELTEFATPQVALQRLMVANGRLKLAHYAISPTGEVQVVSYLLVGAEVSQVHLARTLRAVSTLALCLGDVVAGRVGPSLPESEPTEALVKMFDELVDGMIDEAVGEVDRERPAA